mgnify:CR=1 FL=1
MRFSDRFSWQVSITFLSRVISLFIGVGTSIILARFLGPYGKGVYSLAILLPSMVVTFGNLGVGPATTYYVARNEFPKSKILGNNVLLTAIISTIGISVGIIMVFTFRMSFLKGIPVKYLLLSLVLVPLQLFFAYVHSILLGDQKIKEFNYIQIAQSFVFFAFLSFTLVILRAFVFEAICAGIIAQLLIDILLLLLVFRASNGIVIKPDKTYLKRSLLFGSQVYLANVMWFLNFRLDMLLLNCFLGPTDVGIYSIAVGLAEKLWLISSIASTILFPRISSASKEKGCDELTPLVARTVFWFTVLGSLILAIFGKKLVILLFSTKFLPAVVPLQILLIGVVAVSVSRILGDSISAQGRPILNVYRGIVTVLINIVLNMIWIPKFGIIGAALASLVSYNATLIIVMFFYCRVSGNTVGEVIIPQKSDWRTYMNVAKDFYSIYLLGK